jgi:phosphatidylinositol dimannoside acyltransferase
MSAKRRQLERHLHRVDPTLEPAPLRCQAERALASYGLYWLESMRLPRTSRHLVETRFRTEGYEHLERALEAGRGAIIALPHLGGWEWAGRWIADRGVPLTVVVEPLHPPALFEWFVDLRRSLGMNVIALSPRAGTQVLAALKDNHVVCLLCDRDLGRNGIAVEFFGERTTLPGGPATLALRSGAPLLPTAIYFEGRRSHLGVVQAPIDLTRTSRLRDDVSRVTQDLATRLEELIRRDPTQWHLLAPNWPSDPGYRQPRGDTRD